MLKLPSFFVLKLETARLKEKNYQIDINLNEARKNGEVVRLSDSELLRAIQRIKGIELSQELLDSLLKEKLYLSRRQNSPENRKKIQEVSDKLDEILYEKDIVVLKISDTRHYKKVIERGLKINGIIFRRLLCGAGHARRSSALFASELVWDKLNDFLNCGRKQDEKIATSKFNAYLALASSSSHKVSTPIFAVLPDYEIQRKMIVDWFISRGDDIDPTFEEKEIEQTVNVFDGQGLVSVSQAQTWMADLELSYLPSSFLFRAPFAKGLLVVLDFHLFAKENGITKITDIYGVEHYIDDIECILSESQFKMANFYDNLNEYNKSCKERNFSWGISRVAPHQDKDTIGSTYQYIQSLDIKDEEISEICEPTFKWLTSISGLNWKDVLIFLLGELNSFDEKDFQSADYLAKAIMLEPDVLKDQYFRKKMLRFINKKIREFYVGTLKIPGHYSFLISDPIAQCQHFLGLDITGILKKGMAFSSYWNKKNVNRVSIFRSPTTFRSEHFSIDFQFDKSTEMWYNYLESGVVINIFDDWPLRMAGCDFDGDLVLTTPNFVNNHYNNLRIPTYEREKAEKKIINEDSLWETDILSFRTRIGLITNFSTTFFSLLPTLESEEEKNILVNRLKISNTLQGREIDRAKGIQTFPIPEWDKWKKAGPDAELHNKLLCNRRPYFMKYIYSHYRKKYKHHWDSWDNVCNVRLGYSLEILLKKEDLSETEEKIKDEFYQRSPLIDSNSTMNLLCHYAEGKIKELKETAKKTVFNHKIYMDESIPIDEAKLHKMNLLFAKWSAFQRNRHDKPFENDDSDDEVFQSKDEYIKVLEREAYYISNNLKELTNLIVKVCYELHPASSKEFAWKLFEGSGIIENLKERCRGFISVPLLDDSGSYEYLGRKYRIENIVLGESDV